MTRTLDLSRRGALVAGMGMLFAGRAAYAAVDGDLAKRKLVVIIARGGMDGLSATPPIGDPNYQALRGQIAIPSAQALRLDGDFGLHPSLPTIHALAQKDEARIAPAIATPDRARSHFEAQDVLESGASVVYGTTSGWLNRMLEALPARSIEALSVGAQAPLILRGKVQAASWSPGMASRGDRLPMILADLYASADPMLARALASGVETESMAEAATRGMAPAAQNRAAQRGPGGAAGSRQMGATVANFMTGPEGPQVVALSLEGWDTHANQGGVQGQIAGRFANLDGVVAGLSEGLGAEWKNTVVLVVTEFGRTARANGTGGTDHGTASSAILLGGALKKGGIIGDWPTLAQGRLFEGRDLAPTLDMRALFKGVLEGHYGIDRRALDNAVFADSAAIAPLTALV